jgi:hypothetical protein
MSEEIVRKILRAADLRMQELPERPAPSQETAETFPEGWVDQYDSTPAHIAKWLADHDNVYSHWADLLHKKRSGHGIY